MSFQAMADAVKVKLPAAKKCLLMMLANYADEAGCCYPSVSTLALDSGLSERSVQNYLREFAGMGLIEIQQRKTETGSTSSNLYVLSLQHAPKVKKPRKARNQRGANAAPHPEADAPQGAPVAGVGCKPCGEGVQTVRGTGGANAAPKPISKPITDPVSEPESERSPEQDPAVGEPDAADHPDHESLFATAEAAALERRRKFAMHWQWAPSEEFAARCRQMGVVLGQIPTEQAESLLAEFRSYWTTQPTECNQAEWEHKLARQLKPIAGSRYAPAVASNDQHDPRQKRAAVSAAVMDIQNTDW